jgi:hypothetical protein
MVKTASAQVLKTGQRSPYFKLKGVDNKMYSLDDFTSTKSLLIVFICNSNDPDYQDEGFDNMVKFAREYKLNFPYLIDDSQKIAKAFGAVCTPDPFLFDMEHRLVFHGRINDALEPEMAPKVPIMENNIRKILNGQKLEKDFDPSIGCSIKWKDSDRSDRYREG